MSRSGGFLAGLVVGAVAGVALGMLLAPRSGRENRELLLERAPEGGSGVSQLMKSFVDDLRARLERARAAFRRARADARAQLERELARSRRGGSAIPGDLAPRTR